MILALSLVLAAGPVDGSLTVKVTSLDFSYPYIGEAGNSCQRSGSVFVRAVETASGAPVVVRLVSASGLGQGTEAVLEDVRRAGAGKDGTAVYCASGHHAVGAPPTAAPAPVALAQVEAPPMVQADAAPAPVAAPVAAPAPAPVAEAAKPAASGSSETCSARLFYIVKKQLDGKNKFGPSEFDPDSALNVPEAIDCSVAKSRNTNILLVKMVKDGYSKPATVVGAEWGGAWKKEADMPQQRVVKVYVIESAAVASN